jgi:hypothetical protein
MIHRLETFEQLNTIQYQSDVFEFEYEEWCMFRDATLECIESRLLEDGDVASLVVILKRHSDGIILLC